MALKNLLQSPSLRTAVPIQVLAACHARATAAVAGGAVAEPAASVLRRWKLLILQHALDLLGKEDEDDLYFHDGGQQTKHLLTGLVSTFVSPNLPLKSNLRSKQLCSGPNLAVKSFQDRLSSSQRIKEKAKTLKASS